MDKGFAGCQAHGMCLVMVGSAHDGCLVMVGSAAVCPGAFRKPLLPQFFSIFTS